jgi:hypothetical protein
MTYLVLRVWLSSGDVIPNLSKPRTRLHNTSNDPPHYCASSPRLLHLHTHAQNDTGGLTTPCTPLNFTSSPNHFETADMAEKEGSAVPPQAKGSWSSFLKVRHYTQKACGVCSVARL